MFYKQPTKHDYKISRTWYDRVDHIPLPAVHARGVVHLNGLVDTHVAEADGFAARVHCYYREYPLSVQPRVRPDWLDRQKQPLQPHMHQVDQANCCWLADQPTDQGGDKHRHERTRDDSYETYELTPEWGQPDVIFPKNGIISDTYDGDHSNYFMREDALQNFVNPAAADLILNMLILLFFLIFVKLRFIH